MPTVRDTADLLALKKKLEALSASEQCIICAELLARGRYEIAETLLSNIVDSLRVRRLLIGDVRDPRPSEP